MFKLSVNPTTIGKDHIAANNWNWQVVEFTPRQLLDWQFFEGKAIAGILDMDTPRTADEKSPKTSARWLGADLLVVDIDNAPDVTIEALLADDFIKTHVMMIYPSSSHTSDSPRYHLIFLADNTITSIDTYKSVVSGLSKRLPIPTDGAMTTPSQYLAGTLWSNGTVKSLDHCYLNESPIPVSVVELIKLYYTSSQTVELPHGMEIEHTALHDDTINKRVVKHFEQPLELRERVVIEALSYVLDGWGWKHHEHRFPLRMASHHGSNGSATVLNYILNHPDIHWEWAKDGARVERERFIHAWYNDPPKPDGYTVASLFYWARLRGWLQTSPIDISSDDRVQINHSEIGDFLVTDDVSSHALVISGTGTGKTLGAIRLLKQVRPKKSLFLAPSIKLCTNLSTTLNKNSVPNTLYIDNGKTRSADELEDADVLVTTLQTFAMKLMATGKVTVSDYELVVIDESDELISSFSRAGVGDTIGYRSHVNRKQSFWGIQALSRILRECQRVYFLDATATQVSYELGKRYAVNPFTVYHNQFVRSKAAVTFVNSIHITRQLILSSASMGDSLVIACDTKTELRLIYDALTATGAAHENEIIMITADTHYKSDVKSFFEDVESGASSYRVVMYNGAMGSGVSIVGTTPDKIIQIGTGVVSPRKLLQMLNRYRSQQNVYICVSNNENLYSATVDEKLDQINTVRRYEETYTGIPFSERSEIAKLTNDLALLSVSDEIAQRRSPRTFYQALLKNEGRDIYEINLKPDTVMLEIFRQSLERIRARKEEILGSWAHVEPIERGINLETMDADDVARGLLHAYIQRILPNVTDILSSNSADELEIATLVTLYGKHIHRVELWNNPTKGFIKSLQESQDTDRADVTLRLNITRLSLLACIGYLFPNGETQIQDDTLQSRSHLFIHEIQNRKPVYDMVAGFRNTYDKVSARKDSKEEIARALANYILYNLTGIHVRRKKDTTREGRKTGDRVTYLAGYTELHRLLTLKGVFKHDEYLQFNTDHISNNIESLSKSINTFSQLPIDTRSTVLDYLERGNSLEQALTLATVSAF